MEKVATIIYHFDYYDGPLCGIVRYNGKRYWFDLKEENENGRDEDGDWIKGAWYRKFNIRKMPLWKYLYIHLSHYTFTFWIKAWDCMYNLFGLSYIHNRKISKIYKLWWDISKFINVEHKTDRVIGEFEI